jgi:hypothetical protein
MTERSEVQRLRGQGPRVFISYSYGDADLARGLRDDLNRIGAIVRMEDESTLLGRPLVEVLPDRIAGNEVFLQLVTPTSAASEWVAREFAWATSAERRPGIALAIVVGGATPPSAVSEFGYFPAPDGLTPAVLTVVANTALRALALLPLDSREPFQLSDQALDRIGSLASDRRCPLIDSENLLLRSIDATIQAALAISAPHGPQVVTQQQSVLGSAQLMLAVIDRLLPHVAARLPRLFEQHWGPVDAQRFLHEALQRFTRLTVGGELIRLATDWPTQVAPVLAGGIDACAEAAKRIGAFAARHYGQGLTPWALDAGGEQAWLELGFDPQPGRAGVHVLLPDDFDDIARLSLQVTVSPEAEIKTGAWLRYAVPQVLSSFVHNNTPDDVAGAVEMIGWEVTDFRRVGYY